MQKSISKAAITWRLILSVLIVGSVISCEDTNTVGGGVVEPSDVRIDTIEVTNFEEISGIIYSGDVQSISAGYYDDPLFGNHETIAYIKPTLMAAPDTPLNDSTTMALSLTFNKANAYGDTSSTANFSLYRVTELWRARSALSSDQIAFDESQLVGSFSYSGEDSLNVDISEAFFLDYASYVNNDSTNRDSLYNFEFFGLSIVPDQVSAQIIYPNVAQSNFILSKIEEEDSTEVALNEFAFTLSRNNPPVFNNRFLLNNYLGNFYRINFENEVADLNNVNILSAELYLYEDSLQLKSSLPANHIRSNPNSLELRFEENQELLFDLQFFQPEFRATKDSSSKVFKFNITNFINEYVFGDPDNDDLILNINPSGGIIRSTILFDTTSTAALKPKIVLKIAE